MVQPLVVIPCDCRQIGHSPYHLVGDKYVAAVAGGVGAVPLLWPAGGDPAMLDALVAMADGVLLPGSPSNVEPHHYGEPGSRPGTLHDPRRDATTLPLIRRLIGAGVPLLGICRGFQELNVALGGTLHQHVQETDGLMDHREDDTLPPEVQYGPAHRVRFAEGSRLRAWTGEAEGRVNSLHQQGIRDLAPGLVVEAVADDGLVEAVRLEGPGFVYGVQWHPEWQYGSNPLSMAVFRAFGAACRERAQRRNAPPGSAPDTEGLVA